MTSDSLDCAVCGGSSLTEKSLAHQNAVYKSPPPICDRPAKKLNILGLVLFRFPQTLKAVILSTTSPQFAPATRDLPTLRRRALWPLAIFTPNSVAAIILVAAVAIEIVLLHAAPQDIFQGALLNHIQVPLLVFAFWLHAVWLLWLSARLIRFVAGRVRNPARAVLTGLLLLPALAVALVYVSSWGFYLRTSRFANIESLEFFFANSGESWLTENLWRSEKTSIVGFVALGLLLVAGLPFLMKWLAERRWALTVDRRRIVRARIVAWAILMFALGGLSFIRSRDESIIRSGIWRDNARNRLNPIATLAHSVLLRAFVKEKIDAVMAPDELVRIGQDEYTPPKLDRPPSIIFLQVESLRPDVVYKVHQGREVMPHLNALARNGVQFTRAYSQSTHSDYADVCIVSSLYPLRTQNHHYYTPNDPWPKTLIYDLLKPAGYATAIISSQNEKWGGMDSFLQSPQLDYYYDAERSRAPTRLDRRDLGFAHEIKLGALRGGTLDDSHTTDCAISWMREHFERGQPFFLNMNFQSSHFPYVIAPECERPFQPCELNFEASFTYYPPEKRHIVRNAYYNAVHECDRQLGRMVDALREWNRLDDVIFVVMGENGEGFYENRVISHAGRPGEPAIHVALVVHAPRYCKPAVEDYPTELIDVAPTVLALSGWPHHPGFQGIDVLSPQRPPLAERLLFFHTQNPLSWSDALLYQGRWKLIHDRMGDTFELYDVVADPGERHNLVEQRRQLADQLRATLTAWRERQLAYYHLPQYYLNFYPPRPPQFRRGAVVTQLAP